MLPVSPHMSTYLHILPPELWEKIFDHLYKSSDLSSVAGTCATFWDLSRRLLYKRISWKASAPRATAENLLVFSEHPYLVHLPTEVVISVAPSQLKMVCSRIPKPTDMLAALRSFTSLAKLSFCDISLPAALFDVLHDLPNLRILHLHDFVLDNPFGSRPSPEQYAALPLHELAIGHLVRNNINVRLPSARIAAHAKVFSLARAQKLRVFHLHWRYGMEVPWIRAFWRRGVQYVPLAHLEEFSVEFARNAPPYGGHPVPASAHEEQQLLTGTSRVLIGHALAAPRLRRLKLITSLGFPGLVIPPTALPHLREIEAPIGVVRTLARMRELEKIDIVYGGSSIDEIMQNLASIAEGQPDVHSLSIELGPYHDEVLRGIAAMFPSLQELRITFVDGNPSEVCRDLYVVG